MVDWHGHAVQLRGALYQHVLRWFDARRLAAWPSEKRAQRFVWLMLVLHRLSYLAPAVANALERRATTSLFVVNLGMLAATVGWNVVLCGWVQRRRWFTPHMIAIEVGVACLLLFTVTATVPPGLELTSENWSTRYMLATGALLGAALQLRWAMLYAVAVSASYVVGLALALGELPPLVPGLNSLVWFLIIAHVMRWYLCAQGQALDMLSRQRLEEEATRAAERARHAERLAHHLTLHDTVLATLTAIARGGLDHRVEQVRQRCERDAAYVRRLIEADAYEAAGSGLQARLTAVVTEAEQQDMRVNFLCDSLPVTLPAGVVDALAGAAREGLNNVAEHSGSAEAWLTAMGDDGVLTVRIVDRGRGFDPAAACAGFGLRWSVAERVREVGGSAAVSSSPGEGTCVELTWPAAVPGDPVIRPRDSAADRLRALD